MPSLMQHRRNAFACLAVLAALCLHRTQAQACIGGRLYGADSALPQLFTLRTSDGATLSTVTVTQASGVTPGGFSGLAEHPSTGVLWAILRTTDQGNQRALVTVNPSTGAATTIATLSLPISSIAFDGAGTLYGVSGFQGGAARGSSLYTIDQTDGTVSAALIAFAKNGGL